MDMMILGELIRADATGTVCTGFWMPSGGVEGVAGIEVFKVTGSGTSFTIELQTKSSDEADPTSGNIGSAAIAGGATGLIKFDVAAAKDLVRYVVTTTTTGVWMHAQFMQPMWAPN